MSKYNKPTRGKDKTVNHEGDVAYKLDSKTELYSTVCTSMLQNKFYEKEDETLNRIRTLIKTTDPEFVAKLAVYAREKMYLRSIPLVLAVELAKVHNEDSILGRTVSRIVQRADEITEILAYYKEANKDNWETEKNSGKTKHLGRLSKQIAKGLNFSFNKFDEYQFAKYNRKGQVTLKDALFLVHPKAKNKEQQKLFDKIVNGELKTPETWEVKMSEGGKEGADKKEVWEKMISSGKMGYMAMLRNLRNFLEADVSQKHMADVAQTLADPEKVRKSKQLPFRFLSAYKELKGNKSSKATMILNALEEGVITSIENLKGYDYNTTVCVACDVSGSMQHSISDRSKVELYDIGLLLGMLLQSRCKSVITGIFGDTWKIKALPQKSVLQNVMDLHNIEGEVGYSTNGYKVIQDLITRKEKVDKIMIFTDCQMWNSYSGSRGSFATCWSEYKKIHPEAKLYLFDLSGYGNTPVSVKGDGVYLIAGWSEKVFDMLAAIDKGSNAVKEIESIDLFKKPSKKK